MTLTLPCTVAVHLYGVLCTLPSKVLHTRSTRQPSRNKRCLCLKGVCTHTTKALKKQSLPGTSASHHVCEKETSSCCSICSLLQRIRAKLAGYNNRSSHHDQHPKALLSPKPLLDGYLPPMPSNSRVQVRSNYIVCVLGRPSPPKRKLASNQMEYFCVPKRYRTCHATVSTWLRQRRQHMPVRF